MRNPYSGSWRTIEMEQWDQGFIDLVVPGYIAFRENNTGEFQFGAVHGYLDYRIEKYSEHVRATHFRAQRTVSLLSGRL
jgi:hypothetical protein